MHAHGDIDDPFVNAQIEDMKMDLAKAKDIGESRSVYLTLLISILELILRLMLFYSWMELFTVPSNFRRLSLGLGLVSSRGEEILMSF